MLTVEKKQAAESVDVPKCGSRGNAGALVDGLNVKNSRASAPCAIVRCRAMLCASVRKNGCRLGGLRFSRRITATLHDSMCGVSFCGFRNHGLIAPVPFYGLMPCGKPSGLSLPRERSANPRGVSHLLGGWWGISYSLTRGIKAMMRTLSRNVSTAFPSTPEPIFLPVQSCHKRVEERPQVNTFADVADSAEGLFQRAQAAYRDAGRLPSASARRDFRARISEYLSDLIAFCREVEALPNATMTGANHG